MGHFTGNINNEPLRVGSATWGASVAGRAVVAGADAACACEETRAEERVIWSSLINHERQNMSRH